MDRAAARADPPEPLEAGSAPGGEAIVGMGALNPENGVLVVAVVVLNLNLKVMGGLAALERRIGPEGLRLNSFCITSSHFTVIAFPFFPFQLERGRDGEKGKKKLSFFTEIETKEKERREISFFLELEIERERKGKRRETKRREKLKGLSADNACRLCCVRGEAKEASYRRLRC